MKSFDSIGRKRVQRLQGKSASVKHSLYEILCTEISKALKMNMPNATRSEHNRLLSEITDGTYPTINGDDYAAEVVKNHSGQKGSGGTGESGAQNDSLGIM